MMVEFKVTRAHLKKACDAQNWDLLDKLLDIDNSTINDNALYTDTWGDWWGLLMECIYRDAVDGVKVLLKHGASRKRGRWGDGIPVTPIEAAADKLEILALLHSKKRPSYERKTDPLLPKLDQRDTRINRQGTVRDETGLVFQVEEE